MPDCQYCESSFDDEDAYHAHLRDAHADELGPIDRRRVGLSDGDDGSGIPTGPLTLGVVVVASAAVVAYVTVFAGGGGGGGSDVGAARTPYDVGAVHYHGTIDVVIAGQTLDFSRSRYQLQADAFHFEGGDGSRWHVHAQGVTLGFAMRTLGINVTRSTVTFEGTTYRDDDPDTTVEVTVDDRSVDPNEYVLQQGDHVRIVVRRS